MKTLQKISKRMLLTFIFGIAFMVHISVLIYTKLNPSLPEVKYYNKDLKDIDFPLAFRFCIKAKNTDAKIKLAWELGYSDLYTFFNGRSMFNNSIIGWNGHTENGSTIESVEGITVNNKNERFGNIFFLLQVFFKNCHITGQIS